MITTIIITTTTDINITITISIASATSTHTAIICNITHIIATTINIDTYIVDNIAIITTTITTTAQDVARYVASASPHMNNMHTCPDAVALRVPHSRRMDRPVRLNATPSPKALYYTQTILILCPYI